MDINALIVDDSRTIQNIIERTLRVSGVPVVELYKAENGQQALDILRSHPVDLVFAEVARVLRPGGRYYIADLCREPTLVQRLVAYASIPAISLPCGSYRGYGGYSESMRASYTRAEARDLLARSALPPGQVALDSTWLVPILTIAAGAA